MCPSKIKHERCELSHRTVVYISLYTTIPRFHSPMDSGEKEHISPKEEKEGTQ